jgi:WD40 repeat protein
MVRRILLFVLALIRLAPAQPNLAEINRGVVKIVAHKADGATDTGAGILVGIDGETALVATAYHVIAGAAKIEAILYEQQYVELAAKPFRRFHEDLDLGLVLVSLTRAIPAPPAAPFPNAGFETVREGDKVITVGHPLNREWEASINTNTIAGLSDAEDARKFRFTKTAIERGNSGGPVFNSDGALIGMVTRLDPVYAIGVKVDALLSVLRDEWRIATWWKTEDSRQALAKGLAAHAAAARRELEKREPKEEEMKWWRVLKTRDRQAVLERSVLLALESVKRSRTAEGEEALRDSLALLPQPVFRLQHGDTVKDATFSPDGKYVATGSEDGTAALWNAGAGTRVASMKHGGTVTTVVFSADSRYLVTLCEDKTAAVWKVPEGKLLARMTHPEEQHHLAISRDGKLIATASYHDKVAQIWDTATGRKLSTLFHPFEVDAIYISPDGKYIVTILESDAFDPEERHAAWVWEVASGRHVFSLPHKDHVTGVAFSPDGKFLATGGQNVVKLWDTSSYTHVRDLSISGSIWSIDFSPDGRHFIVGTAFGGATLVEFSSGRELKEAGSGKVTAVAFTPDRTFVATGGRGGFDHPASVFEVETGREAGRLLHGEVSTAIDAFSPDGEFVVTTAYRWSSAHVWRLHSKDAVADACARLSRNLTPDEWQRYIGREPYRRTCANLP